MSAYTSYTDPQLINLLGQDDHRAFDALYERHWESLYKSAFYLLRDREASMDILQDVFTSIWERRQKLSIQSVPSYLKAAIKFKVGKHIRSGNFRDSFYEELAKLPVTPKSSPAELLQANELQAILHQAISDLPDKCREIFELSRHEQLSNQEIAKRLGISLKTVEAQMTIALKRIRSAAEPYLIALLLAAEFQHFA